MQKIKMGNIVALLNQKGGVGKTTTAINLAAYLTKAGKKVLLVDLDPQANATGGLGIDKSRVQASLKDVMLGHKSLNEIIMPTEFKGLFIAPSEAGLASVEAELAGLAGREHVLANGLQGVGDFDFILIDCPPSLGLLTINALTAANKVLVPVQAEYYALEGLSQLLQVMEHVSRNLNQQLELLGVVVTMYDKRTSLSEQVYSELKKHFEDKIFSTVIPRNIRLAEAPSHGKPISEYDKWSKGGRAYKKLAKEFLGREVA